MGLYEQGVQLSEKRSSDKWLMFWLLALVAVTGATCTQSAYAVEQDKVLHATTSACIYGATALVGNAHNHEDPDLLLPLAITLGLGLFKELTDQRFDEGDLIADCVGASSAWICFELTW